MILPVSSMSTKTTRLRIWEYENKFIVARDNSGCIYIDSLFCNQDGSDMVAVQELSEGQVSNVDSITQLVYVVKYNIH